MESDKFYSSFFFFFLLYFMFIGIYGIKIVNCDVLLIHSSSITMYKKMNDRLLLFISEFILLCLKICYSNHCILNHLFFMYLKYA